MTDDRPGGSPGKPAPATDGANAPAARRAPGRMDALRERWDRTRTVLRAPRVRIEVYGDGEVLAIYRAFTARHRRFKFTAAKRWGVALLKLPASEADYLQMVSRQTRRHRTKALGAGYRHILVAPGERVDEILEVNRSTPSRQGRPMSPIYVDRERVVATLGARPQIHAIVDRDGTLQAYADLIDIGGTYTFSYLIGHADHLANGVMYLLVAEVVRWCVESQRADGSPAWLMADTFWGASSGLAYFKDRTGFHPYTVDWAWVDRPSPSPVSPAASDR